MTETTGSVQTAREGAVGIVTIERPSVHNALSSSVLAELGAAITGHRAAGVGAIVLTGAGERAFSAGADLDEIRALDVPGAYAMLRAGHDILVDIERSPVPVIAAVNGLALGGGFELVLATAFPVLSVNASFGLPESGLGLIPGYGGTQRLPRAVGPAVAAHLMLTGTRLGAQRAYDLGLSPLPPFQPGELMAAAVEIGQAIAARGPSAQAAIMQALRTSAPSDADLDGEAALAALATGTAEAAEGVAAFKERRPAVFATPKGGTP